MNMRNLLRKMGQKSFRPGNAAAMFLLNATNPQTIKLMRTAMVDVGFKAQRMANDLLRGLAQASRPPRRRRRSARAPVKEQVIHFINKKMPGGLPKKTARALLDIEDKRLRPDHPRPEGDHAPRPRRCSISRAAAPSACSRRSAWPRRRCCGTPACRPCCRRATCAAAIRSAARGQFDKAEKIITDNRVLFHRVANTLNYLDIKTVVVSCGTCYDQLQGYKFDKIFPGCRIIDIHEYLLEKGITLGDAGGGGYLYHDPCHTPMKLQDPMKTVKALVGDNVLKSDALLRRVAARWA